MSGVQHKKPQPTTDASRPPAGSASQQSTNGTPSTNGTAPAAVPPPKVKATGPLMFELEGLVYRLDRAPKKNGRRSVVTVQLVSGEGQSVVDRADLYSHRSRSALATLVADTFGRQTGDILGQLAVVLDTIERQTVKDEKPAAAIVLTPERRKAAEQLLTTKDLLDCAASTMDALGFVGEPQVKRLCVLIAISRLTARPQNALLLAPPGSGKSSALDAVAAITPQEALVSVARLTQFSLWHRDEDSLRHKLIVVDEYEGQAEADHAIRVLQSKGELRLSTMEKGKADEKIVRGPVAVMSGTTSTNLDPQNTSRCLELALDDSEKQTKLVQKAQARAWAGVPTGPKPDLQVWHDAQRLLADALPVDVVIPFATKLTFPSRTTADRRASAKLLGLVAAHAVLYARQRERDRQGRVVAIRADYASVYALVQPSFALTPDGLSPRAVRVYRHLLDLGASADRREIADALGWSYNTAKKALGELEAQELVKVVEAGPPAKYSTVGRTVLGGATKLTTPDEIE